MCCDKVIARIKLILILVLILILILILINRPILMFDSSELNLANAFGLRWCAQERYLTLK